jgi:4-amino-4-deoxy-L-arabinose transferase-like glycosyltransferase
MLTPIKKITRVHYLILSLIFLIGLLLRILYVHPIVDDTHIARDAKQYVDYGYNLFHHQTYSKQRASSHPVPDSLRSPGYPLFIALFMTAYGDADYLPKLIYAQAVLGALLAPLALFVGIHFLPVGGALTAALLVAISPHLITTTSCALTETLFSFLLLSAIAVLYYAIGRTPRTLYYFLAALLFGLAYLTNETGLFIPILIVAFWLIHLRIRKNKILTNIYFKYIIMFIAVFGCFPVMWSLRGFINVPVDAPRGSDRAIVTLSHGAYPDFSYNNPNHKYAPYKDDPMQPAFGQSLENFSEILWERAGKEPLRYASWYLLGKPYYLWSWDIIQGSGDIYINPVKTSLFEESRVSRVILFAMKALHPFLLILALSGIPLFYVTYRGRYLSESVFALPLLPMLICIYFTGLYMIFAPWPRYSIPLRPMLYLTACWTFSTLISYFRNRRKTKSL